MLLTFSIDEQLLGGFDGRIPGRKDFGDLLLFAYRRQNELQPVEFSLPKSLVAACSARRRESEKVFSIWCSKDVIEEVDISSPLAGAIHGKSMRSDFPFLQCGRSSNCLLPRKDNVQNETIRLNPKNPFVAEF